MALIVEGYNRWRTITTSDSANLPLGLTDAIYVGTKGSTGTIVAVMQSGQTQTFVGLLAGTIYPIRVIRINSTTTDASDLMALYIQ